VSFIAQPPSSGNTVLHESLSERRRADDERPIVILQRAGDDLAR